MLSDCQPSKTQQHQVGVRIRYCSRSCTCSEMRSMLRIFSAALRRRASAAASLAPSRLPLPNELLEWCSPLLNADTCALQLVGYTVAT